MTQINDPFNKHERTKSYTMQTPYTASAAKRRLSFGHLVALPLFCFSLAACSVGSEYQRPALDLPTQWSVEQSAEQAEAAAINPDWWSNFNSIPLDLFVAEALANNNDVRAAISRIEQSRAALKIAGADLLPSAAATAGASRTRTDVEAVKPRYGSSLSAGAGISYELDLFGANRAGVDAAAAGLDGTRYDMEALRLIVAGDVAQGYLSVITLQERVRIATANLDKANDILRIVQARYDAGATSALDVTQQKSNVASRKAARAALELQLEQAENALAVLIGRAPQDFDVAYERLQGLTIPDITPIMPATLLERRPDIRSAEADLVAANADITAARAAFFPSIGLNLNSSVAAAGFGDPVTTVLALASSLSTPIFQGGRLEGGVERTSARQSELIETYKKAILTSFQDVENALSAARVADERAQYLATARTESEKAYTMSKELYDAGSIDFQALLDTQTSLLNAQDSYIQARLDRFSAAIDLYKALGGGWDGNSGGDSGGE